MCVCVLVCVRVGVCMCMCVCVRVFYIGVRLCVYTKGLFLDMNIFSQKLLYDTIFTDLYHVTGDFKNKN